jgi:3-dehydroquinate dehydratase-1
LSIFAQVSRRSIYSTRPRIVAVVLSRRDLLRAKRLRPSPDFVELRLDALAPILDALEPVLRSLSVPLIMTARHPREGGCNNLAATQRAALLQRFLHSAAYIDIELRSVAQLRSVLRQARRSKTGVIISFHDFKATPSVAGLRAKARAAAAAGADVFKVATRTDTRAAVERLLQFFEHPDVDLPISAMGIGRLGRVARIELARRGTALVYTSFGRSRVEGQIPITQLRSTSARFKVQTGAEKL